jgi:hypothetical protein
MGIDLTTMKCFLCSRDIPENDLDKHACMHQGDLKVRVAYFPATGYSASLWGESLESVGINENDLPGITAKELVYIDQLCRTNVARAGGVPSTPRNSNSLGGFFEARGELVIMSIHLLKKYGGVKWSVLKQYLGTQPRH